VLNQRQNNVQSPTLCATAQIFLESESSAFIVFVIKKTVQHRSAYYIFIFQVYLPCVKYSNDVYSEFISKLYDLYCIYSERGTPIFMGDFNADVTGLKGRKDCNLRVVNTLNLSYGSLYTYVSYDDICYSTIDHMCIPVKICDLVVHCEGADNICLNMTRHKPILCCLIIHCTYILYRI